ncbi:peflin isoform X3 [Chironomus tepperi]|uniref:peflin isoform X3 n=1 Tax=Chironomus tepperi TaxID=113505 RepID=UPI00391F90EE
MAYQGYNPYGYGQPQENQVNPEVQNFFSQVDKDQSGRINSSELQQALINGKGQQFSDQACSLMISMFDVDRSGTIDVYEFEKLFNYINQWLSCFKSYDRDSSGAIEEAELGQAFSQMGFRFSPQFVQFLIGVNDPNRREIAVDQFIVLCIKMHRFTEAFRQRDTELQGVISIGFEDFLRIALACAN